jgi:hypothetical protein
MPPLAPVTRTVRPSSRHIGSSCFGMARSPFLDFARPCEIRASAGR